MAVSYIEINTEQLQTDINAIREQTVRTKNGLDGMMGELEELNGMWQGRANEAFRRQTAKDREFMETMLGEMQKLAESMENARKEYIRCENEVISTVESIRI